MAGGWQARTILYVSLPCPLLVLLTACAPIATLPEAVEGLGAMGSAGVGTGSDAERVAALLQLLEQERQRNATVAELFERRGQEIDQLRTEVQRLHEQENGLRTALERATGGRVEATAAGAGPATGTGRAEGTQPAPNPQDGAPPDGDAAAATKIATLQTQLSEEQTRREAAENTLARLKEETSTPPFEANSTDAGELASANREIVALRTALAQERNEREHLASELSALQRRAEDDGGHPKKAPKDRDLRARLRSLEKERDTVVESFNRSLAENQQRTTELEQALALARATAATAVASAGGTGQPGDSAAMQVENTALRGLLDEEHHRTEKLAAKLKIASRVTDLIFKMQAQQAEPETAPQP